MKKNVVDRPLGKRGAAMGFDYDYSGNHSECLVVTDYYGQRIDLNDEEARALARLLVKAYLKD